MNTQIVAAAVAVVEKKNEWETVSIPAASSHDVQRLDDRLDCFSVSKESIQRPIVVEHFEVEHSEVVHGQKMVAQSEHTEKENIQNTFGDAAFLLAQQPQSIVEEEPKKDMT
jgi:hypothetical protein